MRVAVVSPVGALGGAERVLLDLVRVGRAQAPDLEFVVVLLADGPLALRAEAVGASVELLPMPEKLAELGDTPVRRSGALGLVRTVSGAGARSYEAAKFSKGLCSHLLSMQPDVVHSNGMKAHMLLSPLGGRVPVLWHVHDFVGERPLMRYALRAASGSATAAVCISRAVAEDCNEWLPGLRTEVVPNGVDLERFSPGPGDGALLDRLAGLPPAPDGTVRIGIVGTYARWKGQDVFLQAAAKAHVTVPVRYYVIGGPQYKTSGSQFTLEDLSAMAARLGLASRVGFVPFQEELAAVYRSLDVVVHASTRPEPFGLTIAEAMACGRAVIASRSGGSAELFVNAVEAVGLRPVTVDGLALAMAELAADPVRRASLGRAARSAAEERHSAVRFAGDVLKVYRSVTSS